MQVVILIHALVLHGITGSLIQSIHTFPKPRLEDKWWQCTAAAYAAMTRCGGPLGKHSRFPR